MEALEVMGEVLELEVLELAAGMGQELPRLLPPADK